MTNRRNFFKISSLILAGSLFSSKLVNAALLESKGKKSIGLQLYSLRDAMKVDPVATLKKVAEMGFTTLEAANYADGKIYGMTPSELNKVLKGLGMKMTSAHLGGPNFTKETQGEALAWWKQAIVDHKELGVKFLVKPSMPIPTTMDELKAWCDYYNAIGELASASNIQFGFHNHNREFVKIGDELVYDLLIKNTDPNKVFFEMDVYWVMKGGSTAVEYMNKYPGRFPVLHIKDEKEIGESGLLDFKPIYRTAYKYGLKDFFIEVERYNFDPIISVQKSYDFINSASYVK